ncbi:MAG: peptide chain release factor 1 [Candidatus Nealsonbacteria bacterium]
MADFEKLKAEYDKLLNQLSDPGLISDWEKFEELSKKKSFLEKILENEKALKELKDKIEENKSILNSQDDKELYSLAQTEIGQLKEKEKELEKELENALSEDKPDMPSACIMEIRAGTGGEEAALFASDLFKMYSKYAQIQNWDQRVLDSKKTSIGGIKEITFELKGKDSFLKMISEAGVHRVQRIPSTEKSGRVHTSTASVACLAKPKKTQIKINPADLRIDCYRASGPGGQYVNKRETAVRITHLPTNVVVTSQTERNQLQNKENAMSILEAKVMEKKEAEQINKLGGKRNAQIGQAKRAEKIRTYNFPQDRLTDHRIKKSFHNLEAVMEGKLDPVIEALKKN